MRKEKGMEEQRSMMIGKARVLLAMSAPAIKSLTSQGYSPMDAATTMYVIQRKPKRGELTISDGTIRLSPETSARLKELRVYTEQDGGVFITAGDAGEVNGYEYLGQPNPETYAIALCAEHNLDAKQLRVNTQEIAQVAKSIPMNEVPHSSRSSPSHVPCSKQTGICPAQQQGFGNTLIWRFMSGGEISHSPTVYDNRVYFGSSDGYVYALDATCGREIWRFDTKGDILTSPAVSNGYIYVGTKAGRFIALDCLNGDFKWSHDTSGIVHSSPHVANSMVFFGSLDGTLHALDCATGHTQWTFRTKMWLLGQKPISSSPALCDNRIYFGCDNGILYALDSRSGKREWYFPTKGSINCLPAISGDTIVFGSTDGNVYAVNRRTGNKQWVFKMGQNNLLRSVDKHLCPSDPAIASDNVYIVQQSGLMSNSRLYALRIKDGHPLWHIELEALFASSPAVFGEYIVVGVTGFDTKHNGMQLVDARHCASDPSLYHLPIESLALMTEADKQLFSDIDLLLASGGAPQHNWRMKHKFNTGGGCSSPVVRDGVIFFGCGDGYLYAVR
jgi:outer membrane protein assembly factor BamB